MKRMPLKYSSSRRIAVRVHEEDAVEVLEQPEEDADDGVLLDVVSALVDVDVGLVDEQDGAPARRALQGPGEVLFERV
jgi:hypothetical protein